MEKLALKLAYNISSSNGYDKEQESVIAYGLIAIIQIAVTILLILILGILIESPIDAMLICFSASILRKYSGGAHARTAEICTIISVVYCIFMAYIAKFFISPIYNNSFMIVAIVIIFGISIIVIYKLAPVDSPNKPIRAENKIKRMRKGSFIVLAIYFIISSIFFALSYKYQIFKAYGISMLFGISWQILTLTPFGFIIIERINNINILERRCPNE